MNVRRHVSLPASWRQRAQAAFPRLTRALLGPRGQLDSPRPPPRPTVAPEGADRTLLVSGSWIPPTDHQPCAVVHAYHLDVLDELLDAIENARITRAIVTTPPDRQEQVRAIVSRRRWPIEVEVHENRGRDLLPFLRVAARLHHEGVAYVVKIHTKRTPQQSDGTLWRRELVGRILEPGRVPTIVRALEETRLGCVGAEGHLLPLGPYWGWNEDATRALVTRMHLEQPSERDRFVAGSMFWLRLDALRPLFEACIEAWEFEPEGGHLDGTLAHAIERAIAISVRGAGFDVRSAAAVCGELEPAVGQYAFAQTR